MPAISSLSDKNNNSLDIHAKALDHTVQFSVSGKISGTANATNFDGTAIDITTTGVDIDISELSGAVTNTQIADYAVSLEKLAPTAYTTNVTEGSNKLLTSHGACINLLGKHDTADEAVKLKDYNDTTKSVKIGYAGRAVAHVNPTYTAEQSTVNGSGMLVACFPDGSDCKYKDVHASNVHVGAATMDANGNDIVATYETKADAGLAGSYYSTTAGASVNTTWHLEDSGGDDRAFGAISIPSNRSRVRGAMVRMTCMMGFARPNEVSLIDINVVFRCSLRAGNDLCEMKFDYHGPVSACDGTTGWTQTGDTRTYSQVNAVCFCQIPVGINVLTWVVKNMVTDAPQGVTLMEPRLDVMLL